MATIFTPLPSQEEVFVRVNAATLPTPSQTLQEAPQQAETPKADYSSCVVYARRFLPWLPLMSTPADLEPNADCRPGAALLMQYGAVHHIGVVTEIKGNDVCFREANYKRNQETFRCLPFGDNEIRGCFFPG